MKKTNNKKQAAFFAKLEFLMALSDKAFENYLPAKFYLHALCIRKNNKAVYRHIRENVTEIPDGLRDSFIQLLNHYDIWLTQFENFRNSKAFALNDPFVFHHLDERSSYPKNAVAGIRAYAQKNTKEEG